MSRAVSDLFDPAEWREVPGFDGLTDVTYHLDVDGRVARVAIDRPEVLPGIRFLPTPGHSIDHASIELTSDGETAIFPGDVFHHPVEVYDPDLVSVFCEFPEASRSARRRLLDHAVTTGSTLFSSHFPCSSVGHIARTAEGFEWQFFQES